jgi:hypothetical protein
MVTDQDLVAASMELEPRRPTMRPMLRDGCDVEITTATTVTQRPD